MTKIKNMGHATARFNEGIIISGSANNNKSLIITGSATILGNLSDYILVVDNDENSSGHVLKLSTDGNGSGTRILEMEDGDGDIVFRARADGRFGFGPDGVSSMGAGTFVVGIDNSSHTSDIAISQRLQHLGDSNTYMDFPSNDNITFAAGGSEELKIASDAVLVKQYIKHSGDENTWINFTDNRIRLNAGGNNFIDCEDPGSAPHKVRINNGGNNIDFVIKDNSGNVYFTADASTSKVGVGATSPIAKLDVSGSIAITSESSTPSQPADGQGYLYSKSDGKLYWRSYDIGETDLTAGAGGGGGGSGDNLTVTSPKTGNYTASNWEFVLVNLAGASGDVTITLPAASADKQVAIKINSQAMGKEVIVDGNSSETIDGSATKIMNTDYESMHLISDGSAWWRIS